MAKLEMGESHGKLCGPVAGPSDTGVPMYRPNLHTSRRAEVANRGAGMQILALGIGRRVGTKNWNALRAAGESGNRRLTRSRLRMWPPWIR
jgi:hypothetical protein